MMGSLALIFGLLFFVGLVGAVYKKIAQKDGAFQWFAFSSLGLLLYVSLLFFAAGQNSQARRAMAPPAAAKANTEAVTPPNAPSGPVKAPPAGVSSQANTLPNTVYPSPRTSPGSTAKSVYGTTPP
ncbi:MAG TPA: hypothetical protein VMW83_05515 [Spirochaetia bacterium]|nr:hypothetical protein [Spirochaetia bacterium]